MLALPEFPMAIEGLRLSLVSFARHRLFKTEVLVGVQ